MVERHWSGAYSNSSIGHDMPYVGGGMKHVPCIRKGAAAVGAALLVLSIGAASAQTQGMERRDERQDDRAGARATKQACKAGDEKTRAECRQAKRTTKQQGRHDGGQQTPAPAPAPTTNSAQ